jgi:hypothetical protein
MTDQATTKYYVTYRFKLDDNDSWGERREKSPDVNGTVKNGHYRTVDATEAAQLAERTKARFRKNMTDDRFEVEIVEANRDIQD